MFDLGYPEVSPESVAIHSLDECARDLALVSRSSLYIISAACSAHRSLQAALTAALAGSANIGASPPKLRAKWLKYLEHPPGNRPIAPGFRVMSLRELRAEAACRPLPWSQKPLSISAIESFALMRLASYRDDFEHPKQLTYVLTLREVTSAIVNSLPLTLRCLEEVQHSIYDIQKRPAFSANLISERCSEIEEAEIARLRI